MPGYNYIDLFHGIGGFAYGAHLAGMKFERHYCSDIEPYCQKLYALRFPDSVQLGDITKIDTEELKQYGNKWIITGGFPCQDISIAGKGAGITGARSGLWFEYWRLIRDLRPRFAIMENVGALTFRGLDAVLGSLSEIGYNAEWQDIRASDMGAPHRRERIWIMAYPAGCYNRRDSGKLSRKDEQQESERQKKWFRNITDASQGNVAYPASIGRTTGGNNEREHEYNISEIGQTEENQQSRYIGERGAIEICSDNVSNYYGKRCEEQHNGIAERPGNINGCDAKRKTKHSGWTTEPAVGRLVNGLPGRVDRLKGLGNAIVPQIAELLFNQIKELL